MFPIRLSEVTPAQIQALISAEVSEGSDIEFKRELPAKNPPDAWMNGGKIGDEARDQLAAEIIAFANFDGGTLVLGLGEDSATKKCATNPTFAQLQGGGEHSVSVYQFARRASIADV